MRAVLDLPGRQSRWADRQSWTLEERPPHLFREIEERIAAANRVAEEERIAAEKAAEGARREAEERERQWHLLIDQANKPLAETHRATHLRAQAADAWGPNRPTSVTPATSPTSRPSTKGPTQRRSHQSAAVPFLPRSSGPLARSRRGRFQSTAAGGSLSEGLRGRFLAPTRRT
jgi:hypothetical protein